MQSRLGRLETRSKITVSTNQDYRDEAGLDNMRPILLAGWGTGTAPFGPSLNPKFIFLIVLGIVGQVGANRPGQTGIAWSA